MTGPPTTDPRMPEVCLAEFAATLSFGDLPAEVRHQARRSLVNVFATAMAGCRQPAIDMLFQTRAAFSSGGPCALVGRSETTDPVLAALVNAASANVLDFDDTHEATIIHPAAPVFAACLAQAQATPCSGERFLAAFAVGCEVSCRIGLAVSPSHYARGWHISATCGVFGAAVGVGVMLGLDAVRMRHALAAAAVRSGGLVETLGTDAKSLGIGGAASDGLLAAHLARNGLAGPPAPLSGDRGWLHVHGDPARYEPITHGLGADWELSRNTYKPYPTGVVLNPVIDACLQLRGRDGLALEDVASIEIRGHPLLRQRADRPDVDTAREAQLSAHHAVAITMMRGKAGLPEFEADAVRETRHAGRPVILFHDDHRHDISSIEMRVHRRTGGTMTCRIEQASGSLGNPLSDQDLTDKFLALAARSDWRSNAAALLETLWQLDDLADVGLALSAGQREPAPG